MTPAAPLYGDDLAYVHATGFAGHAIGAAPAILAELDRAGLQGARVIELGCGGGDLLAALRTAGHDPVGVEPSPALRRRARQRVPGVPVQDGTADSVDLSGAQAVVALGEVFNYLPATGRARPLRSLFRRVAGALPSGGLLLFDLLVQGAPSLAGRGWREGEDWFVATEFVEAGDRGTRTIVTFVDPAGRGPAGRRRGSAWRRSEEVHRLRIPSRDSVVGELREAGFAVRVRRRWGDAPLLPRRLAFLARRR
ncbi:MAG: methyltransferase domain-containing protein [Pseudomonadales bacterium]|nr:methyltransferase domain-containing protein [Pseudomonadales bacterium]